MKSHHWIQHSGVKKRMRIAFWRDDRKRLNALKPEHGGTLPENSEKLLRVESDYFVARAIFRRINGVWGCVKAAPIIKWMKGKSPDEIKICLLKMGAAYRWEKPEAESLISTGVAGSAGYRNTAHEMLTAQDCPGRRGTEDVARCLSLQTADESAG